MYLGIISPDPSSVAHEQWNQAMTDYKLQDCLLAPVDQGLHGAIQCINHSSFDKYYRNLSSDPGEQGWCSGERTRLPPTRRYHVGRVCYWLSSLHAEVFLRALRFSPFLKTNTYTFQFDPECLRVWYMRLWLGRSGTHSSRYQAELIDLIWFHLVKNVTYALKNSNLIFFIFKTKTNFHTTYPFHILVGKQTQALG